MVRKYELDSGVPEEIPPKGKRVSLTKKALSTEEGRQLLVILNSITSDGELTLEEILGLYEWLNSVDAEFPALNFLRSEIEVAAEDGKLTPEETLDLFLAIERVLPPEDREAARRKRLLAEGVDPDAPDWANDPATQKQKNFIESLGGDANRFKTKGEASREIDRLLSAGTPASNRQMMVLRFWNVVEYADRGKPKISEWMDEFYAEDPDHLTAWNLWKAENGDKGAQSNPLVVPIGIGRKYLARVKGGGVSPSANRGPGVGVKALGVLVLIAVGFIGLQFIPRSTKPNLSSEAMRAEPPPSAPTIAEPKPELPPQPSTPAPLPAPIFFAGGKAKLKIEYVVNLPHGIARFQPGSIITIKSVEGDRVFFDAYGQTVSVAIAGIEQAE